MFDQQQKSAEETVYSTNKTMQSVFPLTRLFNKFEIKSPPLGPNNVR